MSKCIKCGSYAFNLYKEDIDQGGLCDVHYWQYRAHRAEALAEQSAQQEREACAQMCEEEICNCCWDDDARAAAEHLAAAIRARGQA
jgi:predicted  nucleic acid-binding Zn-ribbon protein